MTDDDLDREPVYYYDREHRLNRASRRVRDFNTENSGQKSLPRRLFANKGNVFIFISILIICAMFAFNSRLSRQNTAVKIGGNSVSVVITIEEGVQILSLVKTALNKGNINSGELDIAVSPASSSSAEIEDMLVFMHRVIFHPVESEIFRVSLPFDIDASNGDFVVVLKTNDEIKSIKIKAVEPDL